MERYMKVPVEFSTLGDNRYAVLNCPCLASKEVGRGRTEDEAFADLQRKLGYEEAGVLTCKHGVRHGVDVNGKWVYDVGGRNVRCADCQIEVEDELKARPKVYYDPFAMKDPWHPCEGNGYEVNEIEFQEDYGMTVAEYYAECERRGVPPVREYGRSR